MWLLRKRLQFLEDYVNNDYAILWPEGPQLPAYKLYRLFTTTWYKVVLEGGIQQLLSSALKTIVEEYQNYLVSRVSQKRPRLDPEPRKMVLRKFFRALMDLSINERTVNFIGSTEMQFDHLY